MRGYYETQFAVTALLALFLVVAGVLTGDLWTLGAGALTGVSGLVAWRWWRSRNSQ